MNQSLLQNRVSVGLLLGYFSKKSLGDGLVRSGDVYHFLLHGSTTNILISARVYTVLFLLFYGGGYISIAKRCVSRPDVVKLLQEIIGQ